MVAASTVSLLLPARQPPCLRPPAGRSRPTVCPGFEFDRCLILQYRDPCKRQFHKGDTTWGHFLMSLFMMSNFASVESNTRTYHGRVRSKRQAERPDGVGQAWMPTELPAKKQKTTVFTKASKKNRFNISPEAQTSEFPFKPTVQHNQRLTTGLLAVYQGDVKRALCLDAEQWTDVLLSL